LYLTEQKEEKHRLEYDQKLKALTDRELYMKHQRNALRQQLIDQHVMELEIEEKHRSYNDQCIANESNVAAQAQSILGKVNRGNVLLLCHVIVSFICSHISSLLPFTLTPQTLINTLGPRVGS
jgi:hypothetical protein